MTMLHKDDCTSVNSLNFNQNFECFVSSDENGFRIFNTNPLKVFLKLFIKQKLS